MHLVMQEATSEIITLSSDDETECPPLKKLKGNTLTKNTKDSLKILKNFKEIIITEKEVHEEKKQKIVESNSLTIIIESDVSFEEGRLATQHNDTSNVVILDDDNPPEETVINLDESTNKDPTVIVDDLSAVPEEDYKVTKKVSPTKVQDELTVVTKWEPSNIDDRPSTSGASETHKLFEEYLETCAKTVKDSQFEARLLQVFPKLRKQFSECESIHNEANFKKILTDSMRIAKYSPSDAVVSSQRLSSYFLDNTRGPSVNVEENDLPKIKKLEKICNKLLKKLKKLEESELNFDDDKDSTYIMIDRYSQRLNKVYNKYCQLLKKNPNAGRLSHEKIQFVSSKYTEVNRAITKTYKHNKFPTYYDIEKCIRKCVEENNLPLSEFDIKEESKHCFTSLGNLLQLKRKKELYEVHSKYVALNDPAMNDEELKAKLQESKAESEKRMNDVVEKYVKLQENNFNPDLSEDSDDSHYQSSEENDVGEDKEKENKE